MVVTIYIFKNGNFGKRDVHGDAICQCGTHLAGHVSSNSQWLRSDLTNFHVDSYKQHLAKKHAPEEFYALTWLDEPMKDEGFKKALELNKAMK